MALFKNGHDFPREVTFAGKYRKTKGPFKRRIASRRIEDTHVIVTVKGTDKEYEIAEKVIREAARKFRSLSDSKISFEIRLVNHE